MNPPHPAADPAPPRRTSPTLSFLETAKRCEIAELEHLALTCELVDIAGRLVHGLQRERGLSNRFLGSARTRHGPEREQQILACDRLEDALHDWFARLDRSPGRERGSARLYSRIAYALQGFEALPRLRAAVSSGAWDTSRATAAYARMIAVLLALVFEAADSATDPEVSRLLVAMFNYSQGKELAGQERALGAAMLARGVAGREDQLRLVHLIESQERCIAICREFASGGRVACLPLDETPETVAELERLRRILLAADAAVLPDVDDAWFDRCSRRLDEMRRMEDRFADELRRSCHGRIEAARAELAAYALVASGRQPAADAASVPRPSASAASAQVPTAPAAPWGPTADRVPFFDDPEFVDVSVSSIDPSPTSRVFGPRLERSVLDLVREQSQRLQAVRAELDAVRSTLNERKIIERAKGLLMAHRQLSEDEAHKTLRQLAMNQNRRLIDIAEAVLAMAEILPGRARTPPAASSRR